MSKLETNTIDTVSGTTNLTIGSTNSSTVTIEKDLVIPDKIVHDGDTNTAIRFPESDTVAFETNGSERMRIDSEGKIFTNQTAQFDNCVTIGGAQFTGDFQIEVSGLTAVTGSAHRRFGMRLSYAGVQGDLTNAQQKDVLLNINGLTGWTSVAPVDTGGGTVAVTVNSSSSTSVTFTVTTPAAGTVGAYVATLFANDGSEMECNG